jgi:hypothetical protein
MSPTDRVGEMKIRTILALALIAMFAIPGSASEFATNATAAANTTRGSTNGLFYDPDAVPQFSITLPTHFTAINATGYPPSHFG